MRDSRAIERLHELLNPRSYLHLGSCRASLIALARCGTVAVAPAPSIPEGANLGKPWLKLYAAERDAFFATWQPDEVLDGEPLGLALIEGGQPLPDLARDLDAIAQWAHAGSYAVVLGNGSAGDDVRRLARIVGDSRPDLDAFVVDAKPAPLLIMRGFNPAAESTPLAAAVDAGWDEDRRTQAPVPFAEALATLMGDGPPVTARLDVSAPVQGPTDELTPRVVSLDSGPLPRVVFAPPIGMGFEVAVSLEAQGIEVVRLQFRTKGAGGSAERNVYLDVERPGALYHDLDHVALAGPEDEGRFRLVMQGALNRDETLGEIALSPVDARFDDVAAMPGMSLYVRDVAARQIVWPAETTPFVPARWPGSPRPDTARTGARDAVVFAWYVPERMPELGEYYLGLLRYHHPDSKLFVGMNHGSDPVWADRFAESGLDAEVRWARPEIGDYWDATGFLTALEGFHHGAEEFDLVWFAHTKGGSRDFSDHADVRYAQQRAFWARRGDVQRIFTDPTIGIFAPQFNLTPPYPFLDRDRGWTDELAALQRVYRDGHPPLGLNALDTFYVMRAGVVRRFCEAVGDAFFRTDPGVYGATRWFFEMAVPSIAAMQGFEPFIDLDIPGANDPRDDLMVSWDPLQVHRLAGEEVARWRGDPLFEPKIIPWDRPAWDTIRGI